jgi:hypothetical protein
MAMHWFHECAPGSGATMNLTDKRAGTNQNNSGV